jgi:hypothetical protein
VNRPRAHDRRSEHGAFQFPTVDDLLFAYACMKEVGIEPVPSADHGATTAFYYFDPNGHCVPLVADNLGDWEELGEYLHKSPQFAALLIGTFVDPDKMVAARQAGTSPEELHRRAYSGEFLPALPSDPGVLRLRKSLPRKNNHAGHHQDRPPKAT